MARHEKTTAARDEANRNENVCQIAKPNRWVGYADRWMKQEMPPGRNIHDDAKLSFAGSPPAGRPRTGVRLQLPHGSARRDARAWHGVRKLPRSIRAPAR